MADKRVVLILDDDFRDAHTRAFYEHILDKTEGWPHMRSKAIYGCDDLCSDQIVTRLYAILGTNLIEAYPTPPTVTNVINESPRGLGRTTKR